MNAQRVFGIISGAIGLLVFFLLLPRACQETAVTPTTVPPTMTPSVTVTAVPPTATSTPGQPPTSTAVPIHPTSTPTATPVPTVTATPTTTASPTAVPPSPSPSPTPIPDLGIHVIRKGDTYWEQALDWYGDPYCWPTLQNRNGWDRFLLPIGGMMAIPGHCLETVR